MSNLEMIKSTGAPLGGGTSQAAMLTGMKTKFSFMCVKCQAKYETEKEYAMTDNIGKTVLKQSASSGISNLLYSLLGRIPVVGSIISSMAGSAVYSAVNASSGNQFEISKEEAFEEIKGKFMQCTKCGDFGCAACVKDGICPTCRQAG
ncbi:MAG: hypothetical protein EPN93_13645 [Spirochaetes bacterium]|nr:MAG: hypothetical protein EPN93_13645 [Spirochaetota bacterium]